MPDSRKIELLIDAISDLLLMIYWLVCRNSSYWGKLCFLSTPDGDNCGLVKNLALTSLVSTRTRETPILEVLSAAGMENLSSISLHLINHMNKVLLNGSWVGSCHKGEVFASQLRSLRRRKHLHREVILLSYRNFLSLKKFLMCNFPGGGQMGPT